MATGGEDFNDWLKGQIPSCTLQQGERVRGVCALQEKVPDLSGELFDLSSAVQTTFLCLGRLFLGAHVHTLFVNTHYFTVHTHSLNPHAFSFSPSTHTHTHTHFLRPHTHTRQREVCIIRAAYPWGVCSRQSRERRRTLIPAKLINQP